MFRGMANQLTRGLVLKRKLPQRVGGISIFVSPVAALSYLKYDIGNVNTIPQLIDAADMFVKEGDVVWDIGANVGIFSYVSAWKAGRNGRVVAVEADTFLVELMQKTNEIQDYGKISKVDVIPAAVSSKCGFARLSIAGKGRGANHLENVKGSTQTGRIQRKNWVCAITLDSILEEFPAPNVIKIDVEGAEYEVLLGAKRVLTEYKPLMIIEVMSEFSEKVAELLRPFGYVFYDMDNPGSAAVEMPAYNTIAVPSDLELDIENIASNYKLN